VGRVRCTSGIEGRGARACAGLCVEGCGGSGTAQRQESRAALRPANLRGLFKNGAKSKENAQRRAQKAGTKHSSSGMET
jgi:hypothetical protein